MPPTGRADGPPRRFSVLAHGGGEVVRADLGLGVHGGFDGGEGGVDRRSGGPLAAEAVAVADVELAAGAGLDGLDPHVQGHHAVMDGLHVGKYYAKIQAYLNKPDDWLDGG